MDKPNLRIVKKPRKEAIPGLEGKVLPSQAGKMMPNVIAER
jgi:hypothetical protein